MPDMGGSSTGSKSLYVGNLTYTVTEEILTSIFSAFGHVSECKVIRDKQTSLPAGYGFVCYEDVRSAELALASLNGRTLYGQELRVNWAFQKEQAEDTSAHFHIFVGDLSPEVNDWALKQAFRNYEDCTDARVLWDHMTNKSKSYGFVAFRTRKSADDAINKVNGCYIGRRKVRCSWAQHKQDLTDNDPVTVNQSDPTNCNVYVGNLAPAVTEDDLRGLFQQYGNVLAVKLYRKGSYAFVHFAQHDNAVRAIVGLNNFNFCNKCLKCSWGRHQTRQPLANPAMMNMMPHALQAQLMLQQQMQGPALGNPAALLQQQMAGLSLGGSQQMQMLQQEQAAQMDPGGYLYNLQAGGLLPPNSAMPAMYFSNGA